MPIGPLCAAARRLLADRARLSPKMAPRVRFLAPLGDDSPQHEGNAMSRSRPDAPRAHPQRISEIPATTHILVATEGSDGVSPEIRVARAIADQHGSKVDVLSVVIPPMPSPIVSDFGLMGAMNPRLLPPPDLGVRRLRIRDELFRAGRPNWNETVVAGWPGEEIPAVAKQLGATMIVMGIGRHAPVDRLLGSETALQVLQTAEIPVLAVTPDLMTVPRRVLASLDFSDQSEVAAHVASELVADDGTLSLVHVRTDWTEPVDPHLPVDLYAAGVEQRFDQLERQLTLDRLAPRKVERAVRHGDPVRELLRAANEMDCDLIAVGARTHSRLYRVLMGSVAAKLLRGSHRSVLVIPANAEHTERVARAHSAQASAPAQSALTETVP
jgi:nucleotide-binding universal stress UspA family protein